MNIVGTMVGMSLMASAAPMVTNMAIAPAEAAKRAENFGLAETSAVAFAATYEGATSVGDAPDGCFLQNTTNTAYTITCEHGEGDYRQSVTRSFRLETPASGGGGEPVSRFQYPAPPGFTGIECHTWEEWGINSAAFDRTTNTWVGKSCSPTPTRALVWYNNSNPDNWMYNIDNHNGWGWRLND